MEKTNVELELEVGNLKNTVVSGNSRDFLPLSCYEIKATNPNAQSGLYFIDPDYAMSLVESVTNRADVPNPDARVDGRNDVIYFWMERVLMVLRRLFIKDAYKAMHPLIIIRVYGFERVEP